MTQNKDTKKRKDNLEKINKLITEYNEGKEGNRTLQQELDENRIVVRVHRGPIVVN